jgi:hypothetical protein
VLLDLSQVLLHNRKKTFMGGVLCEKMNFTRLLFIFPLKKLSFQYIQTRTLYYDVVGEMTFKLYELVL